MTSSYPDFWKVSRIVPIRKKGGNGGMESFRPISILPCLSKIFETVLKDQIMDHLNSNTLLSNCHYGFRPGGSTSSLLLNLTEDIRQNSNDNKIQTLISLDLSKAFDTIDHITLINKLSTKFTFSATPCKLLYSYLNRRRQFVSVGANNNSSFLECLSGVPQGSILGPLFFLIYMNDFVNFIETAHCKIFLFADDINLLFRGETAFLDRHGCTINNALSRASKWAEDNRLNFNPLKSKAVNFGPRNHDYTALAILLNGTRIPFENSLKCLGLTLDNRLLFDSHITNVASKVNSTLRSLYSYNCHLPMRVKSYLAQSLLMTHILYCLDIFSGTTSTNMRRTRLIFNRVIRFIFNLRVSAHITEYVKRFLHCSFHDFVKIRVLCTLYQAINYNTNPHLQQRFRFLRSSRNTQLNIPLIHNSTFERSFIVRSGRLFNELPSNLRCFGLSLRSFKHMLVHNVFS